MNENEFVETLKRCTNFEAKRGSNGVLTGYGSISHFPKCYDMTPAEYDTHYEKCKKELEALPWEKIVVLPRMPKENEYPTKDGEFITMLDANEHEVIVNTFKNGSWLLYNRTHVKWWMPLTQTMIEKLIVY